MLSYSINNYIKDFLPNPSWTCLKVLVYFQHKVFEHFFNCQPFPCIPHPTGPLRTCQLAKLVSVATNLHEEGNGKTNPTYHKNSDPPPPWTSALYVVSKPGLTQWRVTVFWVRSTNLLSCTRLLCLSLSSDSSISLSPRWLRGWTSPIVISIFGLRSNLATSNPSSLQIVSSRRHICSTERLTRCRSFLGTNLSPDLLERVHLCVDNRRFNEEPIDDRRFNEEPIEWLYLSLCFFLFLCRSKPEVKFYQIKSLCHRCQPMRLHHIFIGNPSRSVQNWWIEGHGTSHEW